MKIRLVDAAMLAASFVDIHSDDSCCPSDGEIVDMCLNIRRFVMPIKKVVRIFDWSSKQFGLWKPYMAASCAIKGLHDGFGVSNP